MHKNHKKRRRSVRLQRSVLSAALCALLLTSLRSRFPGAPANYRCPIRGRNRCGLRAAHRKQPEGTAALCRSGGSLFQDEISASRLDLIFLLKNPEGRGITKTDALIAPISMEAFCRQKRSGRTAKGTFRFSDRPADGRSETHAPYSGKPDEHRKKRRRTGALQPAVSAYHWHSGTASHAAL